MLGHEHGVPLLLDAGNRFCVDVVVTWEDKEVVGDLRRGRPQGVSGPELPFLDDDLDRGVEFVEIPDNMLFAISHHHHDIADPVLQQGIDDVLDDRPVRDRDHGFRFTPGEWPEATPFSCR